MQLHFATTVRTVVLSAVAPACLAAMVLCGTALGAASVDAPTADALDSDAAAEPVSPPAVKRFDPAALPEVGRSKSPLGYYYAELTPSQTSALRRGFKLPLDALATAKSPTDLKRAVILAPLPDASRPLLPVSPASESLANPFADNDAVSFRKDPLKALGALLGATGAQTAGAPAANAVAEEDDPFGGEDAAPVATPQAEAENEDDPFGSDSAAEPAEEEDPFGDF